MSNIRRCPKCNNSTVTKITKQNPIEDEHRQQGLFIRLITFPFRMIWWLVRLLFVGQRRQQFHKETFWRCNYCAHTWKPEGAPDSSQTTNTPPDTSSSTAAAQPVVSEENADTAQQEREPQV